MNKLQIISVFTKIMELLATAASFKIIFPNKTKHNPKITAMAFKANKSFKYDFKRKL